MITAEHIRRRISALGARDLNAEELHDTLRFLSHALAAGVDFERALRVVAEQYGAPPPPTLRDRILSWLRR